MGTVFKFEFLNRVRKKSFIISTAILFVVMLLLSFIPAIVKEISSSKGETKGGDLIGIVTDKPYIDKETMDSRNLNAEFFDDRAKLEDAVKSGEVFAGFVISDNKKEALVKDNSFSMVGKIEGYMQTFGQIENLNGLKEAGLTDEEIAKAYNNKFEYETTVLGSDAAKNYWLAYAFLLLLYFINLSFGNMVSMNVAREKNDRTMEILITSTTPKNLIRGKVYASSLSTILIVLAAILGFVAGQLIAKAVGIEANILEMLSLNVSFSQVIVMLLYFAIGYIMYMYLYACAGSLVTKMEELNTTVSYITFLQVIAFMTCMFSLSNPGGAIKFLSIFPPTSPYGMIARYGLNAVNTVEIAISLALLIVTTFLIRNIAIRIYENGVLNYGTKPNFMKSVRNAIKK